MTLRGPSFPATSVFWQGETDDNGRLEVSEIPRGRAYTLEIERAGQTSLHFVAPGENRLRLICKRGEITIAAVKTSSAGIGAPPTLE